MNSKPTIFVKDPNSPAAQILSEAIGGKDKADWLHSLEAWQEMRDSGIEMAYVIAPESVVQQGRVIRLLRSMAAETSSADEADHERRDAMLWAANVIERQDQPDTQSTTDKLGPWNIGIKGNNRIVESDCGNCGEIFRPLDFALLDDRDRPICDNCGYKIVPELQRLLEVLYAGRDIYGKVVDDDDVCPRCGMHEQATHHPLCQHRDGTPTNLTDAEVRQALRLANKAAELSDIPW